MTNELSLLYHLDESTFIFRGSRSDFFIFILFFDETLKAKRIAPAMKPRFAASHLVLFCLPMSHKKDARLVCVNHSFIKVFIRDKNDRSYM